MFGFQEVRMVSPSVVTTTPTMRTAPCAFARLAKDHAPQAGARPRETITPCDRKSEKYIYISTNYPEFKIFLARLALTA
jgi:hypothetical protein